MINILLDLVVFTIKALIVVVLVGATYSTMCDGMIDRVFNKTTEWMKDYIQTMKDEDLF